MSIILNSIAETGFSRDNPKQVRDFIRQTHIFEKSRLSVDQDENSSHSSFRNDLINFNSIERSEQQGRVTISTSDEDRAEISSLGMKEHGSQLEFANDSISLK